MQWPKFFKLRHKSGEDRASAASTTFPASALSSSLKADSDKGRSQMSRDIKDVEPHRSEFRNDTYHDTRPTSSLSDGTGTNSTILIPLGSHGNRNIRENPLVPQQLQSKASFETHFSGSSAGHPALERSMRHFTFCFEEFDKVCARYETETEERERLSESISDYLENHAMLADPVDIASALTVMFDQMLTEKESVDRAQFTKEWICGFLARLYPLVKVVANAGVDIAEALAKAQQYPDDLCRMLNSVSFQAHRLSTLKGSEAPESVTEKSMDLLSAIIKYYSTCLDACQRGLLVNTMKQLFEELDQESRNVTMILRTAIDEFNQALWDYTLTLIQDINKWGREKHDQDLFEWLSPSSSEVFTELSSHIYHHLGGTLEWLQSVRVLNSWMIGSDPRPLWLSGLPGVGKSVIAAEIIRTLSSNVTDKKTSRRNTRPDLHPTGGHAPIYLAFFFCKNEKFKLRHAHDIVRTFAYQLARQSQVFRQELENAHATDEHTLSANVGVILLLNRLIEAPLSILANTEDAREVYCVIDGFDEAKFTVGEENYWEKSELGILLERLSDLQGVHLLVLSRQSPQVARIMDTLSPVRREIIQTDNGHDIDLYVGWRVSKSDRLSEGFRHLHKDAINYFHESSHGNFLLTYLKLQALENSTSDEDFESALSENQSEAYPLYHHILDRLSSSVELRQKTFIREVIRTTMASPVELEVTELQALVEEKLNQRYPSFPRLLTTLCGTFLCLIPDAINAPNHLLVQIVHQTFRDYITSAESLQEEFHVLLPQVHSNIAKVLLQYLTKKDFGSQLTTGHFVAQSDDLARYVQQRYPLLKYAAGQWSHHLRNSAFDQVSTQDLCIATRNFLIQGPLLLWIEALGMFRQMPALSRTREDTLVWVGAQAAGVLPFAVVELSLFKRWTRDLDRLCTEYIPAISERPNAIYAVPFELFPSPSLFHDRYKKGNVSISGCAFVPLNPAIVGVSNIYKDEYDLSAFSHSSRTLRALSNTDHIRILDQTFGGTVDIIRAPGPAPPSKWAVLAMAFNNSKVDQRNLLAVVHVPMLEAMVPYRPQLYIWDLDTLDVIVKATLALAQYDQKICLLDSVRFCNDPVTVCCGVWKYRFSEDRLTVEDTQYMKAFFANSDAIVLSPDRRWALTLTSSGRRALSTNGQDHDIEFGKPRFYNYLDDNPENVPLYSLGPKRYEVAPFPWLQFWREVTRSYQFSQNSRWFARLSYDACIVLHDLENQGIGNIIYKPDQSWSDIMVNNLTFDAESEQLAWTFNHRRNNVDNTRIQIWSTKKTSSVGGFQLGRYGWRERVDFCSDTNQMITYRKGFAMWDISLGLELEANNIRDDQDETDNWIIGNYVGSQYTIQLRYSQYGRLFLFYPQEVSSPTESESRSQSAYTVVIHALQREGLAGRVSFNSSLLWQRFGTDKSPKWGFQSAINGQILAVGTKILDISDITAISVKDDISIFASNKTLETSFHIKASLIACLQHDDTNALVLHLYCLREKRVLRSITFKDDTSSNPRLLSRPLTPSIIVFDQAASPTYLILIVAQPDEPREERGPGMSYSARPVSGPVQVWVYDIPSLTQRKSFRIQDAGWVSETMVHIDHAATPGKIVCCESRKSHWWCRVWIIDVERGTSTWQLISGCRYLAYVPIKDMFVIVTSCGLVKCKSLKDMESDILQNGGGQRGFDDSTNAHWVKLGWKVVAYVPPSFLPTAESGIAVYEKGELAYVSEFGKRLVQICFDW